MTNRSFIFSFFLSLLYYLLLPIPRPFPSQYESGEYTLNEIDFGKDGTTGTAWGYEYANAELSNGGTASASWSVEAGTGINTFAVLPPEASSWCLSKVEYQICARPGPPVIDKVECLDCDADGLIDSDGASLIEITGYNFGPTFTSVRYGPLKEKGLGYEMRSCNLTANVGE